jgi:hypothetical protein
MIEGATAGPASLGGVPVPSLLASWLAPFRDCFTAPVWQRVLVLVAGAVLAPGQRTVSAALRVMGLAEPAGLRPLLRSPEPGPLEFARPGADRRGGDRHRRHHRAALGAEHPGPRHLPRSGALLARLLCQDQWPGLAVADGGAAYPAGEAALGAAVPDRRITIAGDSSFATLELIEAVRRRVRLITRLRPDANLFAPAPPRQTGQRGRRTLKGKPPPKLSAVLENPATAWTKPQVTDWYGGQTRLVEIVSGTAVWCHAGLPPAPIRWVLVRDPSDQREPQAFLSTNLDDTPAEILGCVVSRWRVETTFQEVRRHLGVETQRQWSDLAILRTTPALLGLFSLVRLWAGEILPAQATALRPRGAAWYAKQEPAFSDAMAAVRRALCCPPHFSMSRPGKDVIEIPATLLQSLVETVCYAA